MNIFIPVSFCATFLTKQSGEFFFVSFLFLSPGIHDRILLQRPTPRVLLGYLPEFTNLPKGSGMLDTGILIIGSFSKIRLSVIGSGPNLVNRL